MVSTFTPNIQIEEPARGDDVGTWDTPVNNNSTLLDLVAGGIATIGLNNSNVTLSAAQFRCKTITFNSTLTGNVQIVFPSSFTKSYEIQNICTGNFFVQLASAGGGQVVCAPPGETVDVFNDGTHMKYKNLARIGSYMDYCGTSVPSWIGNCTVLPYLNCDGTTFSSATYPVLTQILGGTTLPDRRGTVGATLNQGTARLVNVINANSNLVVGGVDQVTLTTAQMPTHSHGVSDPGHVHASVVSAGVEPNVGGFGSATNFLCNSGNTAAAATGISIQNAGSGGAHGNVQPTTVYGLSLIRAG